MADLAIQTEQLTKMYGKRRGLAGLDLAVNTGEVYGFLGPNGAGKTTTIRILLDLIRPTSGRAELLGGDPHRDGVALRRRVEDLRERGVRRVEIHFEDPVSVEEFAALPGVSDVTVTDTVLRARLDGRADPLVKAAAKHTVLGLLSEEPDLEELFVTYYRGERDAAA